MEITVVEATECPVTRAGLMAGVSTQKDTNCHARGLSCLEKGHTSVFEHCNASVVIKGISRACANQLVRHRIAAYTQESQRYVTEQVEGDDWYVVPPSAAENGVEEIYRAYMRQAGENYANLLVSGMPREDARYVLPNAAKTSIAMTLNARSLMNLAKLRLDGHAQWEIREMTRALVEALSDVDDEWRELCGIILGEAGL